MSFTSKMRDFSFQTGAILNTRIAQPLRKKSSSWMRKLGYLNQEKKIKIFQEVKMNDFYDFSDSSKMGDRKSS